jgi:GntR family transcriptional regulator, transcriptional repressor for pyruvate dehydrogenase complex
MGKKFAVSMHFDKLNVLSAYQIVSRELRRLIDSGELKAGDQLPTEAELATQFGVNRSTVREGIRQLENEGLVSRQGRKRLTVSVPGSGKISSQATRALVMRQVTFRELWEVALVLEPACAALSAQNREAQQLAALRANVARTRHALQDTRLSTDLDTEFHALVTEGAHNTALLLSREPVGLLLFPAFEILSPILPPANGRMLAAHERISEAIAQSNAAEAENWMRKHIVDFRRGWEMAKLSLDLPIDLPRSVADR